MELVSLVQAKLARDEKCICCTSGSVVVEWQKSPRCFALVERLGDFAVFVYVIKQVPLISSGDLSLDTVLKVDTDLRCLAESRNPCNSGTQQKDFILRFKSSDINLLVELPQQPSTETFLSELKCRKDLHSQNVSLGLPSVFSWLKKYEQKNPEASSADSSNPFANDVFDPLVHMNLQNNGRYETPTVTDSSGVVGFEDSFTDSLKFEQDYYSPPSNMAKSCSRDSLDKIDRDTDFTDSLESIQKQLGIGSGVEMPIGQRPISVRETFVKHYMAEREDEFTNIHTLRIFCGTWNVNGQSPKEELKNWLAVDKEPPDLYAIGFQELDLSKEAFIFSDSPKEAEWQKAVKTYLHPKAKYRKVKSVRLVGVLLIIYIQEKHIEHVHFIDADSVATGILGIMGNKGGVAVRMSLHQSSICFINSHLAAHQEEFERRNQDYRDIDSKMRFKQFVPPLMISEHDLIFWIGDLNYRITGVHTDEIKSNLNLALYGKLLPFDQLYSQLGNTDVFKGYVEGAITFQPTYKYDSGTDNWDTSEKGRAPAWCDRILWKGDKIRQIRYNSHSRLKISDHKPVSALFDAGFRVVDVEKSKKVYEDIMKKLDRLENDYLPIVKLDRTEFFFKDVKFVEPQTQHLAVANIGQVPVTFEFINKLDDVSFCKRWIKVNPYKTVLLPGDSCEISIEVYVEKTTAATLNNGQEKIEDILVLHLHGGKDFFIPISGNYLPSSFGSSIEALVQMHGPIREVPVAQLVEIGQPGSLDNMDIALTGGRQYLCPKEIYRLVNYLHKHGRTQVDLFQQPGLSHEIQQIRDCLDSGVPDILPGSIHSVAESLLLFLESLAEPVIPYNHYQHCLDCSNTFLLAKQILQKIPECHRNVFKYLCAFLRELLKYSEKNNLDAKFLATMFGEVLLRRPSTSGKESTGTPANQRQIKRAEEEKKAAFVYHFLTNEYDE